MERAIYTRPRPTKKPHTSKKNDTTRTFLKWLFILKTSKRYVLFVSEVTILHFVTLFITKGIYFFGRFYNKSWLSKNFELCHFSFKWALPHFVTFFSQKVHTFLDVFIIKCDFRKNSICIICAKILRRR